MEWNSCCSLRYICTTKRRRKKACHAPLLILAQLSWNTGGWSHFSGGLYVPQDCWLLHSGTGCACVPASSLSAALLKRHHTAAFRSSNPICSFPLLKSLGSEDHRKMWSSPYGWNRLGTDAFSAVCLLRKHLYICFQPRKPGAWHHIQQWEEIGLQSFILKKIH